MKKYKITKNHVPFYVKNIYDDPNFDENDIGIALAKPELYLKNLRNPNELAIPDEEIAVIFDYPLTNEAVFTFKSKGGFTVKKLAQKIVKAYQKIYELEDKDVGGKTGHIPGMLNRDRSKGRFGIWGHDIGDLVLCNMTKKRNGKWELGVDS